MTVLSSERPVVLLWPRSRPSDLRRRIPVAMSLVAVWLGALVAFSFPGPMLDAVLLAQAIGGASGSSVIIPVALVGVGIGIILAIVRLAYALGAHAAKVTTDVTNLVGAINGLRGELERDRNEARAAQAEIRKNVSDVAADLREAVEALRGEISQIREWMARHEGASKDKAA
jgi:hypothetical protein